MPLLPQECPNCGRLHPASNFQTQPGPVQRELASALDALKLMLDAYERHAGWCGYNKDAPGDIIHRVASMRAREVLQAAGMLEYEEERHLIWCASRSWFGERRGKCDCSTAEQASVPAVDVPRASAAELEEEPKVERPAAAPLLGQIPSYDAGWNAHEVGLSRKTVEVLSPDPGWALLGWDMRALLAKRQKEEST